MAFETLIDVASLAQILAADDASVVVVDCRFSLGDLAAGREAWTEATIGDARYAHLDDDLSGPIVPGQTGRHPFPAIAAFVERARQWGVGPGVQVVAFDDKGGPFAARLWWMLRWVGHDAVAVLDGGIDAWVAAGQPTSPGRVQPPASGGLVANPQPTLLADAAEVLGRIEADDAVLVDARAPARYAGEQEPIDAEAGHIPSAVNVPWPGNLGEDGTFKSVEALRDRFDAVLGERRNVIVYCGSGVTACHDLLALHHVGRTEARLYPGSWSEWIVDPARPRATGTAP